MQMNVNVVARDYDLPAGSVREHAGGFESDCLVFDETWFVKIWRGGEAPARLGLLDELHAAGLAVPAPLRTRSGELYAWWNSRAYAVFPLVAGRTARDEDWRLTARALKRVHDLGGIELPVDRMDEPEVARLQDHLDHPWVVDRRHEVSEHIQRLWRTIERARSKEVPNVICHRDFGGANLLVDEGRVAAILDWDQAVIGPREHDLWIAAEIGRGPA